MLYDIDHHLLYDELGIVAIGVEQAIIAKVGMLANLCFKIADRLTNLIEDCALEGYVLDDVHFGTNLFYGSFITYKTGTSTWEEALWVLAKEENTGGAYLLLSLNLCHKIVILTEVFHGTLTIANNLQIVMNKIHVNIIDGSTINLFVFVVTLALIIHQL